MALSILEQSKKLLTKNKFQDTVRLLEPHVFEYRDSFSFHLYLGLAFLNMGEIGNAVDYFSRARELKPDNPDIMAATAVMYLRRGDTTNAVEYYLRVLESYPKYKIAKKGLEYIKKNSSPEAIGDFVQSGKIKMLYPRPYAGVKHGRFIIYTLSLCIIFIASSLIIPYILKTRNFVDEARADISDLDLDSYEKKQPIDMEGSFNYILTEKQVLKAYADAQKYFQEYRDNAAQIEVNRIAHSNASFAVKRKALELAELFKEPSFDSIKDVYSFDDVRKDPLLYEGCWVRWKGMAANVTVGNYSTLFNLLIGYDTKHDLKGVIPVSCSFVDRKIDTNRPIEVLGRVQIKEGAALCLKGITLFQSQQPASKE